MNERVKFMPINTKTTKKQLIEYAKKLEKSLRAHRLGYYDHGDRTFVIRRFDDYKNQYTKRDSMLWQEVNKKVYPPAVSPIKFVHARTPTDAIEKFDSMWNPIARERVYGDIFVAVVNPVGFYKEVRHTSTWNPVP